VKLHKYFVTEHMEFMATTDTFTWTSNATSHITNTFCHAGYLRHRKVTLSLLCLQLMFWPVRAQCVLCVLHAVTVETSAFCAHSAFSVCFD